MKLIYERAGESARMLEPLDVPALRPADGMARKTELKLPRVAESEMSRHYAKLGRAAFGVCDGFYPLGSCTMKYNPKVNEAMAALPGFTDAHPTQDAPGCAHALALAKEYLTEITGMDDMTFEPCAGAHGEFTSMLMVRAYHLSRGDHGRTKIIVPDSAHGTNPASAAMAGFEVVPVASTADGRVDVEALRALVGDDTAALMLTNPNTLGLFDENILEITRIVREAGGVNYYDTAWGYHGGHSELTVGKLLADYPRDSFYLASKFPGYDLRNMGKVEEIFEKQLENSTFLRCHQSFIINMERITGAKNGSFRIGDHVIPISRSYNRVAHEKYDEYLRFQQECNGEETE